MVVREKLAVEALHPMGCRSTGPARFIKIFNILELNRKVISGSGRGS